MIESLSMLELTIIYIVGFAVACGYTGGVRDEMDGLVDMAIIVFWPLYLATVILRILGLIPYKFGRLLRKLEDKL